MVQIISCYICFSSMTDWDSMDCIITQTCVRAVDFFYGSSVECLKNSATCFETNLINGHIKNF